MRPVAEVGLSLLAMIAIVMLVGWLTSFLDPQTEAGTLTTAAETWDLSLPAGAEQGAGHVDITLLNRSKSPVLWHVLDMPPWAMIPGVPGKAQVSEQFSGWIDARSSGVVRLETRKLGPEFKPGSAWRWDVSFLGAGSAAKEATVQCSLSVH